MAGRSGERFILSDECYIDITNNQIIDTLDGTVIKRTVISGAEWRVLELLISSYPNGVTVDRICSDACVAYDDVRKKVLMLRKSHPLLELWLPRCRSSRYRLEQPLGSDSPAKEPAKPQCSVPVEIDRAVINRTVLRSTQLCPRPHFLPEARQPFFDAIDEAFGQSHVVFLQGMGGIGKSELAKQWTLRQQRGKRFDTVVFAQLDAEKNKSNVISLITDDSIFVINGDFPNRNEYLFRTGREEPIEDYFRRKLSKIKEISDERTLIIIDNYDINDDHLTELFDGNYRLLITTRNEYYGHDFPVIRVTEIEDTDHLKRIFFNNLEGKREDISRDDPSIETLFSIVSNHTLTIEIIAKSLMYSKETPESICQKLSRVDQRVSIGEVEGHIRRSHSGDALTPFECIQLLFDLSKLECDSDFEHMAKVLSFMAAMPTKGIALWLLREWSDSRALEALDSLVDKSWLRQDSVGGVQTVSMHPLIKEIVWHDLQPTIEKCHDYLLQLSKSCHGAWKREYTRNLDLAAPVISVFSHFGGPQGKYFYLFEPCINLLWQLGQFDIAIDYCHTLYDSCVEYFGENTLETGYVAKSLGGCYFNSRRLAESVPWYISGLKQMLASGAPETVDLALAYEKAARCYTWDCCQDFDKAQEYFKKARHLYHRHLVMFEQGEMPPSIMPQIRQPDYTSLQSAFGGSRMEAGRMYQLMGDYKTAFRFAEESYIINAEYNSDSYSSLAYTFYDRGVCLYHLAMSERNSGKAAEMLSKALEYLSTAMAYNERMRGRFAFDTIDNHEMLGDVHAALGQNTDAEREYLLTISMLESLVDTEDSRADAVREKLLRLPKN